MTRRTLTLAAAAWIICGVLTWAYQSYERGDWKPWDRAKELPVIIILWPIVVYFQLTQSHKTVRLKGT